MGKVTLPALLGATVIGFVVFALTSFYYRSEYIPKRSVLIVPDAPISIEDGSNAFPVQTVIGFAPIFPDTCYHLTHYWPAAVDIPVASDNPVHYADAIRYNAR
ncbi:hypothetical protein OV212_24350, partial [Salmonella enterica subsp. enterica serovar 1,4,[5],12:i:-]|nr:hypothetical protein [Salmonella enterica subsp. enterica serovar 1,4,[5],12:i:-]